MHQAASVYSNNQKAALKPRDLEAHLLMKGSRLLQEAKDKWDWQDWTKLEEALKFNQTVWGVLTNSAANPENPLPQEIRQNVANIGIFILGRIFEVRQDPKPQSLDAIINLNRTLAAGLRGE